MTDKLTEIKKIYTDYAQSNSDIDSGELYWALGESMKIIEELQTEMKQMIKPKKHDFPINCENIDMYM